MGVRAKFYVQTVEMAAERGSVAKAHAVSRGDANAVWAAATPCGSLTFRPNDQMPGSVDDMALFTSLLAAANASIHVDEHGHQRRTRHPEFYITMTDDEHGDAAGWMLKSVTFGPAFVVCIARGWGATESELSLTISAEPARSWFIERITRTITDPETYWAGWPLTVTFTASTDGYPGDGHAFRPATYPPGVWGHDRCGECSGLPAEH